MSTELITRVRVTYQKIGSLRYIGHIDLHSLLERALRRSGLPLRYSQGFKPKVRLNLDFWLNVQMETDAIKAALIAALPAELPVTDVRIVDNAMPSLQADLRAAEYQVTLPPESCAEAQVVLASALQQEKIMVNRRNKVMDMRPWVEAFEWAADRGFNIRLRSIPQESGRPDELLDYCGIDPAKAAITRTKLIFQTEE
jgi:uncharacterized protein (DUF2344 family)